MNSISVIITQRRKELGLSQLYISDALGYSVQTISKWEQGRSLPNLVSWSALAKILQIDLDALINGRFKSEYNDKCLNNTFSSEKFANNLRKQRKSRNLTQKDLATQLSIPYQTLLAWEKGASFPNVEQFKKLSAVMGLTYDELYFAEENSIACKPPIETNIEQELASKSEKVKSWSAKAKVGLTLALTSLIIVGGALIARGNLSNNSNHSDVGNLPSSEIVPSEQVSSDKGETDKINETLGKPFSAPCDIARYFYDTLDKTLDLEKMIVPVPYTEGTRTIKSVGVDYTGYFDVLSATSGIVKLKTFISLYGNVIVIEHETGVLTIYASLGTMNVEEGQKVEQGEVIATPGEAIYTYGLRSCLHFEVLKNDKYINPSKAYNKKLADL